VLYGQGRRLGPDLTGSNRKNIDYLLENIVDPSSSVGAGFRAVVILLDNGRILNGVISEQNDRTLTLQSAQETITLDRRTIDEIKPTTVSLMPDGLLQNLSTEQIRDLFGYLMSSEQVPLPAE
jgi:putative heme-binding domain-containing protein